MPTADMPLVEGGVGPSYIWWRFWFDLLTRTLQTVQATVNNNVAAAGTTQATATQLESEWNVVRSTPANSGVVLDGFNVGISTLILNFGANALKVYPPSGMSINSGGVNIPYSLAVGTQQTFSQVTDTLFLTQQPIG